jgi:hypothetical protein
MGTDGVYIRTHEVRKLEILNCKFVKFLKDKDSDHDAYIIDIDKIFGYRTDISHIMHIEYHDNQIGFLRFGGFHNGLPSNLELKNITFRHSTFTKVSKLIYFKPFENTGLHTVKMSEITFDNIHFKTFGSLLEFRHAMPNQVQISHIVLKENFGGLIYIHTQHNSGAKILFEDCQFLRNKAT